MRRLNAISTYLSVIAVIFLGVLLILPELPEYFGITLTSEDIWRDNLTKTDCGTALTTRVDLSSGKIIATSTCVEEGGNYNIALLIEVRGSPQGSVITTRVPFIGDMQNGSMERGCVLHTFIWKTKEALRGEITFTLSTGWGLFEEKFQINTYTSFDVAKYEATNCGRLPAPANFLDKS